MVAASLHSLALAAAALLLVSASCASAALLGAIPGFPELNVKQYAGYIQATPGVNLFYWFVEYDGTATADTPVIMWQQGGPGCSSLLGLFVENGPFRVESDGKVHLNALSLHKLGHALWLESPVGTGFSFYDAANGTLAYSSERSELNNNVTADDTFAFLGKFFGSEFPQFQANPFVLGGESYGGFYVPYLWSRILNGNNAQLKANLLKGGAFLGNPGMQTISQPSYLSVNATVMIDFWYNHGLIDLDDYLDFQSKCGCGRDLDPALCTATLSPDQYGFPLGTSFIGGDPNCLYTVPCTGNSSLGVGQVGTGSGTCDPVLTLLSQILSSASVQTAIGARHKSWSGCGGPWVAQSTDLSTPFYHQAFAEGLKILVYSGDADIATIPLPVTQRQLRDIGGTPTYPYQQWYWEDGNLLPQAGGFVKVYSEYTFCTIKGAGHIAWLNSPLAVFTMVDRWLHSTSPKQLCGKQNPCYKKQ